jgi:alpha-glucosidase
MNDEGSPYLLDQGGFDAALVDLTNPEARDWFTDVIAEDVLGIGVSGFMADFGEGLPYDAVLARGDAKLAHNTWPRLWAGTVRDACTRAGVGDCLTWFRSGSLGMGEDASLFWNGDQLVDWGRSDGLQSALLGTFAAGVSGWPLVHSDIGGYTSISSFLTSYERSDELLDRWAELAAFGPVMRTHEGNRPDENPQVFDPDHTEAFARMTEVYAALEPYRAEVLAEASELGLPAIRHGWLAAPGTDAAEVDTQFFLGDSLLVAPVLSEGEESVEVVFPPGEWRNLFTGATYEEGTREVDAPLGVPAAFIRADDPMADQLVDDVQSALQ